MSTGADTVLKEFFDYGASGSGGGSDGRVLVGVNLFLEGGEVVEEGDVAGLGLEEDADDGKGLVDWVAVDEVQLCI